MAREARGDKEGGYGGGVKEGGMVGGKGGGKEKGRGWVGHTIKTFLLSS